MGNYLFSARRRQPRESDDPSPGDIAPFQGAAGREGFLRETTPSSTFSILVKAALGKNISVPVSLDDTVLDLKVKLFALDSDFYPSRSILIHDGDQELVNEQTLRHYNITSNSIIHHILRYDQESQGSLSCITSTSAEEFQKLMQSLFIEEERFCLCSRQELQQVKPEIDPHILREQNIYKACLPGPGIFQCSKTGLAFEVESAASIVYRYDNWSTHLKEADQNLWEPAGPLFNIWALPGTVRAVYLPHFICVSGANISGCSIAHFEFKKMTIQQPKEVMAFTAVLENPSFSLLGVVWRKLRSAISLPVHSLVLIFQQLSAANTTLHLYLIPDDSSVKQAIERQEMSWNSRLIPKPPPFTGLFFGYRYKICSKQNVKIKPEPHLPFCYKSPEEQQLYVEIYIKKMEEEIELFIRDGQNDIVVWEASLRSGDICFSRNVSHIPSGADFLKKHKTELCSRMGQLSSTLLLLRDERVINSEEEQEVRAQNTRQERNRFLLDLVENKGSSAQEKLFQILKIKDPFLVDDLENFYLGIFRVFDPNSCSRTFPCKIHCNAKT
ncbi:caspase recruitment domain-containing protein 8-like isoform X2 [Excalfactoria chinensis]|uniref:caspase recruitment domain-containing protein 8-like isoform X2 n=1 Tax=Excalfactoria chinensis TaxID=46218 RepID=UPI003B3A92CF